MGGNKLFNCPLNKIMMSFFFFLFKLIKKIYDLLIRILKFLLFLLFFRSCKFKCYYHRLTCCSCSLGTHDTYTGFYLGLDIDYFAPVRKTTKPTQLFYAQYQILLLKVNIFAIKLVLTNQCR